MGELFTLDQLSEVLNQGKRICRIDWLKSGVFVFQRPSDILDKDFILKVKSLPGAVKDHLYAQDRDIEFTSYLCMWTEEGRVLNGWIPSENDIKTKDWMVIDK